MVNQNKRVSFKIKRQAKNIFPRDVERTVGAMQERSRACHKEEITAWGGKEPFRGIINILEGRLPTDHIARPVLKSPIDYLSIIC